MLRLALLLIVPCLISAEVTCPDGETTCPEGQVCCTVNDKQSCCDEGQLPLRSDLQAATISNSSVLNALSGGCTLYNCPGTCCYGGCCREFTAAKCCTNNMCCSMLSTCCESAGGCCAYMNECCGSGCCPSNGKCCRDSWSSWCCKKNQRCGLNPYTCYAGAGALSPTTLVTLVAAWLVAYAVKKM
ncbi:hypothetical protein JTE90_013806 [Oedothorax gibbosus]|uniref:Granulin n=1 Tax=Oedothorax gibbosus TaxID=931172 RepID=A0AAV6VKX4_9ARAC|nr:hypothetical protein JTE90_013806 [Oedothorax gibbosus]